MALWIISNRPAVDAQGINHLSEPRCTESHRRAKPWSSGNCGGSRGRDPRDGAGCRRSASEWGVSGVFGGTGERLVFAPDGRQYFVECRRLHCSSSTELGWERATPSTAVQPFREMRLSPDGRLVALVETPAKWLRHSGWEDHPLTQSQSGSDPETMRTQHSPRCARRGPRAGRVCRRRPLPGCTDTDRDWFWDIAGTGARSVASLHMLPGMNWLARTADGYYAMTEGKSSREGVWLLRKGPEDPGRVIELDQYGEQLHRPDYVRRVFRAIGKGTIYDPPKPEALEHL